MTGARSTPTKVSGSLRSRNRNFSEGFDAAVRRRLTGLLRLDAVRGRGQAVWLPIRACVAVNVVADFVKGDVNGVNELLKRHSLSGFQQGGGNMYAWVFVGIAVCASPAMACDSNVPTWRFGSESTATMSAEAGKPCELSVTLNAASILDKSGIAARPEHGAVSASGKTAWTYTAKKKFEGSDQFTVYFTGHNTNTNSSGTAKLVVNVTVR